MKTQELASSSRELLTVCLEMMVVGDSTASYVSGTTTFEGFEIGDGLAMDFLTGYGKGELGALLVEDWVRSRKVR